MTTSKVYVSIGAYKRPLYLKTASYSGDYYSVETSQNRKNIALLGKNGDLSIAQGTETQCIDQEVQAVKLLGNGLLLYSKLSSASITSAEPFS